MSAIRKYDALPALTAARLAWTRPGPDRAYHELMKDQVRRQMPLLARALDRAERETRR